MVMNQSEKENLYIALCAMEELLNRGNVKECKELVKDLINRLEYDTI